MLEPDRREVAVIETGGYFGEMSLLTGDARSASVVARGDTAVLELDAEVFRALGAADPKSVEEIGLAAVTRRAQLAQIRETTQNAAVADAPATFLGRMKTVSATDLAASRQLPARRVDHNRSTPTP